MSRSNLSLRTKQAVSLTVLSRLLYVNELSSDRRGESGGGGSCSTCYSAAPDEASGGALFRNGAGKQPDCWSREPTHRPAAFNSIQFKINQTGLYTGHFIRNTCT